jgi:hypothetical protein
MVRGAAIQAMFPKRASRRPESEQKTEMSQDIAVYQTKNIL